MSPVKDRAIDFYKRSVEISHAKGYQREEASFLGNIGLVYEVLGEYQQAVDFHQHQQKLANVIGDRLGEANS